MAGSESALESALESDIAAKFAPEGGFPTVNFQVLRIERRIRQRRRRGWRVVSGIFRAQLEILTRFFVGVSQAIDRQAQARQHIVVDNIVVEDGIGIECFLVQYDAFVECSIVANRFTLPERSTTLVRQV